MFTRQSGVVSHNIRQKDANFIVITFVYFVFIKTWNFTLSRSNEKNTVCSKFEKKNHIFFNINYIYYHSNQLLFKFLILYVKDQIIPYFDLKSCFSVFNAHWYWVGIVHVRWFHMVCFLWVNCVLLSTWYEYISSMTFTGRFNDPYLLMRDYTST